PSTVQQIIGNLSNGSALVTDRYLVYNYASINCRQLCWSHLIREFVRFSERDRASSYIGRGLLKAAKRLFKLYRRFRAGKLRPDNWEYYCGRLRMRTRKLLEKAAGFNTEPNERRLKAKTQSED